MEIIEKSLKDIKQYENNPRFNGLTVDYLVNSIKQFGFKVPIIIDKNNIIVCGHTRAQAAFKLKMKPTPLSDIKETDNEKVILIDVFMPEIRMANENKSVNRTVT